MEHIAGSRIIYKVLNADSTPCHGGTGKWPPIGEWLEIKGQLIPCTNGIHLCDGELQLLIWIGPCIYEAECDSASLGEMIRNEDKIVVRKARLVRKFETWNDRSARLFACDCAERALMRERQSGREPDVRSWQAIEFARHYASGQATGAELIVARDAARDAAWPAARDAARDAAWDAASDAARATARAAASNAAWAASWAAARAAAWDAARDAAWEAAWEASWEAARAAGWSAERQWQAEQLRDILWNT